MKQFKMTVTVKGANRHYQVFDDTGKVIGQRRSQRIYVACYVYAHKKGDIITATGESLEGKYYTNYWFGRADLIGKGDSARSKPDGVAILVE